MNIRQFSGRMIVGVLLIAVFGVANPNVRMAQSGRGQSDLPFASLSNPSSTPDWQIVTVDNQSDVSLSCSMKLDADNHARISYIDKTNASDADLKYARRVGTSWQVQTIDTRQVRNVGTSLVLDGNGNPHIAYFITGGLIYAHLQGTQWVTETVTTDVANAFYPSLALDSQGYPHISYSRDNIWYVYKNAGGWQTPQNVQYVGAANAHNSLALDHNDIPHISFHSFYENSMKYASWDGTSWDLKTVETGSYTGWDISLALDQSEYPHISYMSTSGYKIKHAYKDSGGWHIEVVDQTGENHHPSLAIDSQGHLHISYTNYLESQHSLKYAHKDAGGWQSATVDANISGVLTGYSSIDIGSNDLPHIAYSSIALKYAWYGEPFESPTIYLPLVVRNP
ncbi:MAG: hypothetical protein N3D16_02590 [Anaerolineales bacterium]|nr:hypothetical protein [Anaerolineales bacterium]